MKSSVHLSSFIFALLTVTAFLVGTAARASTASTSSPSDSTCRPKNKTGISITSEVQKERSCSYYALPEKRFEMRYYPKLNINADVAFWSQGLIAQSTLVEREYLKETVNSCTGEVVRDKTGQPKEKRFKRTEVIELKLQFHPSNPNLSSDIENPRLLAPMTRNQVKAELDQFMLSCESLD